MAQLDSQLRVLREELRRQQDVQHLAARQVNAEVETLGESLRQLAAEGAKLRQDSHEE